MISFTFKFQYIIIISLLLFNFTLTAKIDIIEEGDSKYENEEYLDFFKIQNDIMTFDTNAGEINRLSLAYDNNFNSNWISRGSYGAEYTDSKTNTKYDYLIPNITITFSKKVLINRMIYKAYTTNSCPDGLGYPRVLKVYYKNRDSNGDLNINEDFILVDNVISQPTENKVIFSFDKDILCDQIKLEWYQINLCKYNSFEGVVSASEIILLAPESPNINENIFKAFDKSDYRELTLTKEYQNEEIINLLKEEIKNYTFSDNIKRHVERIIGISNGSIVYEPKREFSTNQNIKINKLYQRGDVESYSKDVLKMWRGGTNRQITGIYAKSNETITFYVSYKKDDRLPCLRFTQYIGGSRDWLGNTYCLRREKESFKTTDFKTEEYVIPSIPGGPIYLSNPYTSEEQSQDIKIYIDGGSLFPIIRFDEDENNYMEFLEEYVKLVEKDNITNPDITEFYTNRAMMTVRATFAYNIYKGENKSPLKNLNDWDIYMKKLYTYDGIQFEENQPYYNIKNNYICIHFRYAQPYALAYAANEHIGIFYDDWIEKAISLDEKEIGWGFPHEIGHMMDINERTISETSNNMISKYSETFIQGDGSWGPDRQNSKIKYLTLDDIDDKLRGCSSDDPNQCYGFFKNVELNYLVWWDLESMYHGYWGKLDNMYRFNSSLAKGLTNVEKFVYFTNLILGMDLGYYFTRWGFYISNYRVPFNESEVSPKYEELMYNAVNDGIIDLNIPQKKYWYVDYRQYNYMNDIGIGCYQNPEEYDIEITDIHDYGVAGVLITLAEVKCPGHLGFEIYETERLIGFTNSENFVDNNEYDEEYVPKYKVIAYDRLLFASKPSAYKSLEDKVFLYGVGN